MKLELRGKNGFQTTEAIRNYALSKLSKLEKYFNDELQATVVCKVYDDKTKVEITIPIRVMTLRAEVEHKDMYAAIDLGVDKLESQIRRNKYKVTRSLQEKQGIKNFFKDNIQFKETNEDDIIPIKKKLFKLEVLKVDEAITQMDLLDHDFYIYKNENGDVCVVYRREDGQFAVIETI